MPNETQTGNRKQGTGASPGTGNGQSAPAASEEITADQLASQLARMRQPERTADNDSEDLGAEGASTEADAAGGENEAALNADGQAETNVGEEEAGGDAGAPSGQEAEKTETAEQDAEEGRDEEQDLNDDPEGALPHEVQERINKRIGKEVAKRKALEEELATLKAERAQEAGGDAGAPGAEAEAEPERNGEGGRKADARGAAREAELQKDLQTARATWLEARRYPNGGTIKTADGKEITFTAEQAMEVELAAQEDMNRIGGDLRDFRKEWEQNHRLFEHAAREEHPKLFVKGTPEARLRAKLLAEFPVLRDLPGGDLAIGYIVNGTLARVAREQAATTAKKNGSPAGRAPTTNGNGNGNRPSPRPTKVSTGGGTAPNGRASNTTTRRIEPTYAEATSVDELAKSFARKRAATASR